MSYQGGNTSPRQKLGLMANMIRDGRLAWRLLNDPRVATVAKVMIPVLAVIYVLSPVDLIPDVIPVAGQLDDLAVLAIALRLFIGLAPPAVVAEHRARMAGEAPQQGGPAQSAAGRGQRGASAANAREDDVVDADYHVIR